VIRSADISSVGIEHKRYPSQASGDKGQRSSGQHEVTFHAVKPAAGGAGVPAQA
jgi:hypothetical protein